MLLDFGLAHRLNPETQNYVAKHSSASVPGTEGYHPPEKVFTATHDVRGDVYSAAATLYHVLTNQYASPCLRDRLPVSAWPEIRSLREVYARPATDPLTPQEDQALAALDTILQRGLAREPERRYPTAEALQLALQTWLIRYQGTCEGPRFRPYAIFNGKERA